MTGIERLVDIVDDGPYSGGMIHISVQKLREICEQIESETVEALAFVREHGGLDEVKKRLMPEGMDWPTVDGKPIDFVTGYEPSLGVLEAVSIYSNGACEVMGHDGIIKDVREIHVATPKVLDADGEEIRVGDSVWGFQSAIEYVVDGFVIDGSHGAYTVKAHYADGLELAYLMPNQITHRTPVLAADGKPLEVGQTVWHIEDGRKLVVTGLPKLGEYQGVSVRTGNGYITTFDPSLLTHTKPEPSDSWERWIEDAGKNPFDYCKDVGHRLDTCENSEAYKARDLVRRAKALAGVSE